MKGTDCDMRLPDSLHHPVRTTPLRVFCVCGLVGLLVELDHVVSYVYQGQASRFAHQGIMLASSVILIIAGTYIGGLILGMVLSEAKYRFK